MSHRPLIKYPGNDSRGPLKKMIANNKPQTNKIIMPRKKKSDAKMAEKLQRALLKSSPKASRKKIPPKCKLTQDQKRVLALGKKCDQQKGKLLEIVKQAQKLPKKYMSKVEEKKITGTLKSIAEGKTTISSQRDVSDVKKIMKRVAMRKENDIQPKSQKMGEWNAYVKKFYESHNPGKQYKKAPLSHVAKMFKADKDPTSGPPTEGAEKRPMLSVQPKKGKKRKAEMSPGPRRSPRVRKKM
jgi:hypothetical protein